ncbi:XRE family transcriptional regulator, partial [Halomonas sp. DQ26W]
MKTRRVTLCPQASLSLHLFAGLIEEGRLRKGWTRDELAERVGVGVVTIRQVAKGSPKVAIGTYFEAAALVGVSLFTDSVDTLRREFTGARQACQHLRVSPVGLDAIPGTLGDQGRSHYLAVMTAGLDLVV